MFTVYRLAIGPQVHCNRDENPAVAEQSNLEPADKALDAALNFLSYRQRTGHEVRRKLVERGFDAETIDAAHWLHSGDIASLDEEGYCRIVGRLKDMLIRGGENIFPREIEEYLYTHPAIEDAQVIGVPSKKYGEEVMAWVKLKHGVELTGEALAEFCKGNIATFKIPKYWKVVDAFPMTVTGKIQKFVMREAMVERLSGG